ncbi:1337_t:CDS:2 [Acaulospora colombiana]|uniref:1337_t:CDS:1 n=1 Tax=Acaulospora colombiana TaxID=27376 RepID=A0ACA9KRH1_9GLOM|nr:1337_t:CDS:2 [Acaulospora colombiana]
MARQMIGIIFGNNIYGILRDKETPGRLLEMWFWWSLVVVHWPTKPKFKITFFFKENFYMRLKTRT